MSTLQDWFLNLAGKGERYLFSLTLVALGLLAISQLLMVNGKVRYYMNRVEFLEGEPYPVPSLAEKKDCWVELALEGRSEPLEIMVNGEVYGNLGPEGIIVHVHPGDLIEVRGDTGIPEPAVVRVVSTSGLDYPRCGDEIVTYGDYDLVGWVIPVGDGRVKEQP